MYLQCMITQKTYTMYRDTGFLNSGQIYPHISIKKTTHKSIILLGERKKLVVLEVALDRRQRTFSKRSLMSTVKKACSTRPALYLITEESQVKLTIRICPLSV